jgi:hypothetical protein
VNWFAWVFIAAVMWTAAWLAATFPWKWLRRRSKPPLPRGDYVPEEWVAEYHRQNRRRHPRNCGCRSCYERNLRSGGLP